MLKPSQYGEEAMTISQVKEKFYERFEATFGWSRLEQHSDTNPDVSEKLIDTESAITEYAEEFLMSTLAKGLFKKYFKPDLARANECVETIARNLAELTGQPLDEVSARLKSMLDQLQQEIMPPARGFRLPSY